MSFITTAKHCAKDQGLLITCTMQCCCVTVKTANADKIAPQKYNSFDPTRTLVLPL